MKRRHPRSTRTDTRFPYTTLFRSLERSGLPAVAGVAHQLKGSGGNFGFPQLTEWAGMLEQVARSGDASGTLRLLAELGTLIETITDESGMPPSKDRP